MLRSFFLLEFMDGERIELPSDFLHIDIRRARVQPVCEQHQNSLPASVHPDTGAGEPGVTDGVGRERWSG
jgi:hypothetical protein